MKPDDVCPLPSAAFTKGQLAFDLVYNLPETCFTRTASAGGAKAVNGLGMLLHQGAEAFTIWTGQPAAVDVMRQALEGALYGK
jgi:shikimate dehydrogenase